MLLFFSLSTVITLRLFVTAHQQEQQSVRLSEALEQAQDTAEQFYAGGRAFLTNTGWSADTQGEATLYRQIDAQWVIEVSLQETISSAGVLDSGEVRVRAAAAPEDVLCRLSLARYTAEVSS